MAEELGRIEKPEAKEFKAPRKLYVIPLIFAGIESPEEYREKSARYWMQVSEQILSQESAIGKVTRVYHESIVLGGEEGLRILERWNAESYRIVKQKVEDGAVLEVTETADLADESMDWERLLLLGFYSRKVADTVAGFFREASKNRFEHISKRIAETLKEGDVALLFMREGHAVQYPPDTDVFSVAPPALDEIHRWLRERAQRREEEEEHDHEHEHEEQEH